MPAHPVAVEAHGRPVLFDRRWLLATGTATWNLPTNGDFIGNDAYTLRANAVDGAGRATPGLGGVVNLSGGEPGGSGLYRVQLSVLGPAGKFWDGVAFSYVPATVTAYGNLGVEILSA